MVRPCLQTQGVVARYDRREEKMRKAQKDVAGSANSVLNMVKSKPKSTLLC